MVACLREFNEIPLLSEPALKAAIAMKPDKKASERRSHKACVRRRLKALWEKEVEGYGREDDDPHDMSDRRLQEGGQQQTAGASMRQSN